MGKCARFLLPGALVAGLIATAAVSAQSRDTQQPDRKRPEDKDRPGGKDRPGDKDRPGGKERPEPRPGGDRGEARPDAAVESWVKLLSERMIDPHDTVRDSARAALVAVGPQALPILRRISGSDDSARAVAARKVIEMIESRLPRRTGDGDGRRLGGPMGPGDGRGFGPLGGSGFGPGPKGWEFRGGPKGPMGPGLPGGQRFGGDKKGPDSPDKRDRGPGRDDRGDRRPPVAPPPGTPDGSR